MLAAGLARFLRWRSLGAVSGVTLAVGGLVAWPGAVAGTAATASCQHAVGPFRVSGTKVLGSGGKVFTPYGITVPGLANYPSPKWKQTIGLDERKIVATADSWCANTVRLQVSQDNLLGPLGTGFSTAYLQAIQTEVSLAERHHLVVVLNDQTETAESAPQPITYQRGPTPGTETFWKDMILSFGSDKQVIFDLFNEPRTFSAGMSPAQEWSLWHDGGTFKGDNYIGMAKLAADLRAAGAPNLFWVEGPDYAASFAGMVRQHAVLTSPGIVYAFHHPAGGHNTTAWFFDFGYLINTHVAPVVDGEWTNYQPFGTANPAECWKNAPTKVPVFLSYLASKGIGMTAYQLQQGLLVKSGTNLADPTTITAAWSCTVTKNPTNEGAGALIMKWYRAHNS
jgi:Cellulase (glycosyl hydrolase family 5)